MNHLSKPGLVVKDLYNFSQEDCIKIARENIVNCVYSSARLEGITVSYEDTRQLCGGIAVAGLTIAETNKINNLHKGWDFILSTAEYPLDYVYLQSLNQIVNTALVVPDAGNLRKGNPIVKGADRRLGIPDKMAVKDELIRIMHIPSVTERAIRVLLFTMKTRIFSVGNKRTAQLAANQILIQGGKGYLRIPEDGQDKFLDLLNKYYTSNHMEDIREYLYMNCICGA